MTRKTMNIACGVALFFLTIELCARIDDAFRYGAGVSDNQYSAARLRGFADGLPRNVPNERFEKWKNNRLGFRGVDYPPIRPPEIRRVVCIGSSETYGLYEGADKEWPAQLRRLLPAHRYQVFNASVVGLLLTQYERYYERYILPLNPDVVILFVNPIIFATAYERDQGKTRDEVSSKPSDPEQILRNPEKVYLRSMPKAKQAVKRAVQGVAPGWLKGYQIRAGRKQVAAAERIHLNGKTARDKLPEGCGERYRDELTRLVEYLKARNVQVILSTYPTLLTRENLEEHLDLFLGMRRFSVELSFAGMIDAADTLNEITRTVAREQGVVLADSAAWVPRKIDYFGDNVHYTDLGAERIAVNIARRIPGSRP